jgi:hypothetical protein
MARPPKKVLNLEMSFEEALERFVGVMPAEMPPEAMAPSKPASRRGQAKPKAGKRAGRRRVKSGGKKAV